MSTPKAASRMPMLSANPTRKYEGIQALRFVAALMVVITHSFFYAGERLVPGWPQWPHGSAGVDIFFVISGFVMVISSGKWMDRKDGWKFYSVRRLVRIVPMYWIATTLKVVVMVVLPGAALHAALSPSTVISSYLFLPTRNADGRIEPLLGVGWTLTFEMFFYLVFGIGIWLFARKATWFASAVMVVLAIGSIFRPVGWPAWAVYFDSIVLYFVVGMWIAKAARNTRPAILLWSIVAAALVVFLASVLTMGGFNFEMRSVQRFAIVIALVAAVVALDPWIEGRMPTLVMFYGSASYSLYLFHPMVAPIVPVILAFLGLQIGWLSVVGSIVAALTAAAMIYLWVEKPMTKKLRGVSRYA